jgi:hypothetical protein
VRWSERSSDTAGILPGGARRDAGVGFEGARSGALAALGLGILAALLALGGRTLLARPLASGAASPSVELWVCDRDARRLVGLDPEGLVVREVPVPHPLRLALASPEELVVLCAERPGAAAPRRLLRLDGRGALLASLDPGPLAADALAVDTRGRAHVLRGGAAGSELWCWDRSGGFRPVRAGIAGAGIAGGRDLRAGPGGVWVLGEHRAWPATGGEWPAGPGELLDLAFGSGVAWELRRVEGRVRLRRLTDGGIDELPLPGVPERVIAGGAGLAWCAGSRGRAWRVEPAPRGGARRGPVAVELPGRPLRGLVPSPWGVWVLLPGAVLRLGPRGELRFAQGGFESLVDGTTTRRRWGPGGA